MWNDLRYAIRALSRQQLLACGAVVTLGIAIGVNTAAFGIVNALMFRSSGVRDPGSLVYVYRSGGPVSGPAIFLSYPDYRDLASTNHASSDVSAYGFSRLAVAVRDEDAQSIFLELVSGNIFRTLGVGTRLGRTLDDTDDPGGPTAQPSVVISDGFWARAFNRSESVLGSTLRIRGVPFTVVGVAERRFRGVWSPNLIAADMWISLSEARRLPGWLKALQDRDAGRLMVVARLKPGMDLPSSYSSVRRPRGGSDGHRGSRSSGAHIAHRHRKRHESSACSRGYTRCGNGRSSQSRRDTIQARTADDYRSRGLRRHRWHGCPSSGAPRGHCFGALVHDSRRRGQVVH
ncbi:MAG: hypothetical protein DMF85_12225 [Acidobacteria bacterium]|nr:MAG: hypothetical protein DMF85_12225 [Acidobacteriota bacterium]